MTTACISLECVCSGAEKPGGNFWMPPYGPLAGSPHRTTPLTSGGAPGVSAHFISPAGMKTAVLPAGFGAAFPFSAAAPCASRTAQEMKTPMTATIVLRIMDVSFPNEGRERQSPGPRSSMQISEPAGETVALAPWKHTKAKTGRTLAPLDPALSRGLDSPASAASPAGASTAASAAASGPARRRSCHPRRERARGDRPGGRGSRSAEGASPARPAARRRSRRAARRRGPGRAGQGGGLLSPIRPQPAFDSRGQTEGHDVGEPAILQPRPGVLQLAREELSGGHERLASRDAVRPVARPSDVEEVVHDGQPQQQEAHEKSEGSLPEGGDPPIREIEQGRRNPEEGERRQEKVVHPLLPEVGGNDRDPPQDAVQDGSPDDRAGIGAGEDRRQDHQRQTQEGEDESRPSPRAGRTVAEIGVDGKALLQILLDLRSRIEAPALVVRADRLRVGLLPAVEEERFQKFLLVALERGEWHKQTHRELLAFRAGPDLLLGGEPREHSGHFRRPDRLVPERADLLGPEREDMLLQPGRVDRFGRREGRETPEPGFPPIEGTCEDEDRAEKEKKEAALLRPARPEANSGWLRAARVLELRPDDDGRPGGERPPLEPGGHGSTGLPHGIE